MSDSNNKHMGRQFVDKLKANSTDSISFKKLLDEFAMDSSVKQLAVIMSLLEIGSDRSEKMFDRNFALSQLAMLVRTCGLQNDAEIEKRIIIIVDSWILGLSDQIPDKPLWGALLAMSVFNRHQSLEKCDHVIKYYGESEAGHQLRKFREDIERANPENR